MKTITAVCLIFLGFSDMSFGQAARIIEISFKQGQAGAIIFDAKNNDFCDYFVTINLDQLSNTRVASSVQVNVKPGTSQILQLKPLTLDQPIGFSFSYSYIKGNANPKLDDSFVYLLPVSEGNTTNVFRLKDLNLFLQRPVTGEVFGWGFSMNAGDTVYAARGGVVSEVLVGNGSPNAPPNASVTFTRLTNAVEVFHTDGSFGRYNLLKNDGIFVKPGVALKAGDPIGIIEKVYERVYTSFAVFYLDQKKINTTGINVVVGYSTFKPKFVLSDKGTGGYINDGDIVQSYQPDAVITQEMTKRERERFLDSRKK